MCYVSNWLYAITAIQLQCQDSLIRGLSGEHRTGFAVKQCEICSLTKCCGRTLCLPSPSTISFGKDPQQRWVVESNRPSGRNSPQSFTQFCLPLQQSLEKLRQRQCIKWLCQWFACFPCLQVSCSTIRCNTALSPATPAASWPLISMALWPVWSAWRLCSVSASICEPGGILENFGVSLSICCLLTTNVAECMEMWSCQQNDVSWRKQQRNGKSLSCLNDHGGWGHVFVTYRASLLYRHPHFTVSALVPAPVNGTIYHLQYLLRPDLQVCSRITPDASASDFIAVLLPALFAAVDLTIPPHEVA